MIGYGCTTCGGKSGPLDTAAADAITEGGLVAAAVLSGNRNFEGRIHKLLRANYIGSPAMVVLYALAGRIDVDFEREPLGTGADGAPVYLRDVWPSQEEIAALLPLAADPALFAEVYDPASLDSAIWRDLPAPSGLRFPWDPESQYLVEPPFFKTEPGRDALADLEASLARGRVLAAFGDSLTTDHISPSGEIPADTPAGAYLIAKGVAPRDFNTYVARTLQSSCDDARHLRQHPHQECPGAGRRRRRDPPISLAARTWRWSTRPRPTAQRAWPA